MSPSQFRVDRIGGPCPVHAIPVCPTSLIIMLCQYLSLCRREQQCAPQGCLPAVPNRVGREHANCRQRSRESAPGCS